MKKNIICRRFFVPPYCCIDAMPAALKRPSPRLYKDGGPCLRSRDSLSLRSAWG